MFKFRRILVSLAAVSALVIVNGGGASAASGASGLSISPLTQELTLSPGEVTQFEITIKNVTSQSVIAEPTVRNFESDGVDGQPKILPVNSTSPNSIKDFLLNLNNIPLSPGQEVAAYVTVKVPENATPGAYYGLLSYQAIPASSVVNAKNGTSEVALTAAVGQLIFITVPGNVTQLMQVSAINVYKDVKGTNAAFLFTQPPKAVGVVLDNLGNAFEKPSGTLVIQNDHGKPVYTAEVNGSRIKTIVLPYSTRVYNMPIGNAIKTPGPYKVIASITYGPGSSILTAQKTIWYLPAWILIIALIVILVIIGLIAMAYMKLKKSKVKNYKSK